MKNISLNTNYLEWFISQVDISSYKEIVTQKKKELYAWTWVWNDFLWWMNLPTNTSEELINDIEQTARFLDSNSEHVVVIWIWGSYLWTKALLDLFSSEFNKSKIIFAGHNLDEDYLSELINFLENKKFSIVVISKSGTTTEPAVAFRLLKELLIKNTWADYSKYIVSITDENKWALLTISKNEWFKTFVIPDDVGWRYSVLTPVWLLPLAIAWVNIRELISWAKSIKEKYENSSFETDEILKYAILRNYFYKNWKKVELLVSYSEKFRFFVEWWKQLFWESEWKDWVGIFPSWAIFSSDLHSIGQYIQEWERIIFETILNLEKNKNTVTIKSDEQNLDELNYLSWKNIWFVNNMARIWTIMAHTDWGVPNIVIDIPELNEYYIWQLVYFFEESCAISCYLLWVNPFNQPWVEAYKKNMFKLLEKPWYN